MHYVSKSIQIFFLTTVITSLIGQSIDDKWNQLGGQVVDTFKSGWDGASGFLKGMEQSFGYVPDSYKYSFQVWNDAPSSIFAATQRLTGFQGVSFTGNIVNSLVIGPNANSGDTFKDQKLYLSVWLCADSNLSDIQHYAKSAEEGAKWGAIAGAVAGLGVLSPVTTGLGAALGGLVGGTVTTEKLESYKIYKQDIYPWTENDTNLYYYRAYTNKETVKGEYLGVKATTNDFTGQFYNNTSVSNITLTFVKDGKQYIATLEPQSFSLLESSTTKPNSIRPAANEQRAFTFSQGTTPIGYLPIASLGIANVTYNDTTKKYDPAGPMLYTYEIFSGSKGLAVSMQGLSVGYFSQPTSGKVRDINPVQCHVWNKSAAQVTKARASNQQADYSSIAFDLPEQVWIAYKTKDSTIQQKIQAGAVFDFTFLRPQLSEQEAWLYIISLQTDDDQKAKQFLDRLTTGKIGQKAVVTDVTQPLDKNNILTSMQANKNGIIVDTNGAGNSGLTGFVVLADKFLPTGVGIGPFYYYNDPSQLQIDQFANIIYFADRYYVKNDAGALVLSNDVMQELSIKIPQWIRDYQKDKEGVKTSVKNYIQQKGNNGIFQDPNASSRVLNAQGQRMFDSLISGPVSIEHYPIVRKAGTNYYVFGLGDKPADWPS